MSLFFHFPHETQKGTILYFLANFQMTNHIGGTIGYYPPTYRLIWRVAGESIQTLGKPKQIIIYPTDKLNKPKELDMTLTYREVILVWRREIAKKLYYY